MEYLTCTSELTPMMIHLRVTADERIIYRISGLLENEDPNIYYLLDTFHLHPDLCPPLSAEGATHLYQRRFELGRAFGAPDSNLTGNLVEESNGVPFEFSNGIKDITVWHSAENAFYLFDNVAYSINFPLKWVIHENYTNSKKNKKNQFGPKVCKICDKYGYQDLIFIGYCVDCSEKCRKKEMQEIQEMYIPSNTTSNVIH